MCAAQVVCYCPGMTKEQVKEVLNRVSTWPAERQPLEDAERGG
jgi:hypothetical protein